jgi:long-chain acyl-CoA synthetase
MEIIEKTTSLPQLFFDRVERYGERIAMREKKYGIWRNISWNEYGKQVKLAGMGLMALGLKSGEMASIISCTRPEWLFADLGIQSAGGITVPIYETNSAQQVEYILADAGVKYIVVEDEEQLDKVLEVKANLPLLEKISIIDRKGLRGFQDPMVISFQELLEIGMAFGKNNPLCIEDRMRGIAAGNVATLVYTSGTTGPPKGAMISNANILWMADKAYQALEMREGDNILSYLPLSHVAERIISLFVGIYAGLISNFVESKETFSENLREIRPDFFFAVPRIWEKFYSNIVIKVGEAPWFKRAAYRWAIGVGMKALKYQPQSRGSRLFLLPLHTMANLLVFRKLRKILGLDKARITDSGGAPIAPDVLKYFHAIGIRMKESYGLTESCGLVSIHQGNDIQIGNVGTPIPGIEVKIGEDGEIMVRGPNIFLGYFNRPGATQETIKDGWLYTGDIGELDQEGNLKITDRKKDIIITAGGKNIAPQYIENLLKFSPYINDAVVIGDRRKYLTAVIIIDEDNVNQYAQEQRIPFTTYANLSQNPEINKLISREVEKVNDKLAQVETIKKFKILDKNLDQEEGELTPTMKVRRKFVSERFSSLIEDMYR